MILGLNVETSLLKLLENSKFEFFLTGSRFFGMAIDTSDYDFFTEDSFETATFLLDHGFREVVVTGYRDQNINRHFRATCPLVGQIDVQLVRDVTQKRDVQMFLKRYGFGRPCDDLWNAMFDIYRCGRLRGESEPRS